MGKCIERVFKTNSLKLNAASHNNASWYTDTDGFQEHSPSRGSLYHQGTALQKIIPFLRVPPGKPDRERQILYDFTYMWNLKNKTNKIETDS